MAWIRAYGHMETNINAIGENLSEYDNKHWTSVLNQYKDLRYQITKKKFKEKQFGLWYDYSKFDNEDNQDE